MADNKFKLKSRFDLTPDQSQAVDKLSKGVSKRESQVLLGVTGSGKTFSVANLIEKTQKPTLIISHNKTLAGQLYQEFRDFFPDNAVSYFVSYYDYYQPEAYLPSTDTYIEKDSAINEQIDKLRLETTANLLTRKDVIVVASVSAIYNIGSPNNYSKFILELKKGQNCNRKEILENLIDLQYLRSDFGFKRSTFRLRGDTLDIYPSYWEIGLRVEMEGGKIEKLYSIDPLTGKKIDDFDDFVLYPAKHYIADRSKNEEVFRQVKSDLSEQVAKLTKAGKLLEATRLKQRVEYDLEMIGEMGYVKGIENYSRYFDGRKPGEAPNSLLGFFNEAYGKDWILVADESHITFPQVRGMYAGDRSRKQTLIDYGFRLPAALDNRPLKFEEFLRRIPMFVATSATPAEWELSQVGKPVEQLLRPTGIPDPLVDIRPVKSQVIDVTKEIKKRVGKGQRSLVTTLTKRTAEDLAEYLGEKGIKVQYLHSDIKTLERGDILDNLRNGTYDCLVGINLLREGLDLPEVSLVAILDADKEGFLRSDTTLIQTMGRAARHVEGSVIMYADRITGSMERALDEVGRRREYQIEINKKLGIVPKSIIKPIRERMVQMEEMQTFAWDPILKNSAYSKLPDLDVGSMTPMDKKRLVKNLKKEMRLAATDLNFELAIEIREKIGEIEE